MILYLGVDNYTFNEAFCMRMIMLIAIMVILVSALSGCIVTDLFVE